jgi:hypothetical protein
MCALSTRLPNVYDIYNSSPLFCVCAATMCGPTPSFLAVPVFFCLPRNGLLDTPPPLVQPSSHRNESPFASVRPPRLPIPLAGPLLLSDNLLVLQCYMK